MNKAISEAPQPGERFLGGSGVVMFRHSTPPPPAADAEPVAAPEPREWEGNDDRQGDADSGKVISLEAYRRRREDADPGQWMLDRFGRDAALGLRQQAGLTARVLAFRRT
jgi:hypothetical protein